MGRQRLSEKGTQADAILGLPVIRSFGPPGRSPGVPTRIRWARAQALRGRFG
jgi:hypothetical protein